MAETLSQAVHAHLHTHYSDTNPGAAILVARAGEVLYENSIGLADLETGKRINLATNFRLASVSKQFTAMCVQLLQQQGLLTYEDKLQNYFPELAHLGNEISIKHLLCHTSGLPDYEAYVDDSRQEQVRDEEVLEIIAEQPHLLFEPGSQYRYSNTGYVLLALLVEKVSGLTYPEFLQQHILLPLGMANTMLYEAGKSIPNRAMGYTLSVTGEAIFSDQSTCSATKGDGCIYTSVQDFLKWHNGLEKHEAFQLDKTLPSINTLIEDNLNWHYGMGWFYSRRSNGSLEMYHTGNTCGFSNLVIRVPESQLLVVYFSNLADNPHLLTSFLDVLQRYPETSLDSDLVRRLLELTR
ncbi:CubicO group peptidase (beta-lactamase class C family) [Pontibacter aydingkolensis]|uniref:Beta-lactamase family protein n=1 Tax=Pontibacter aydingkolensis TaxID=1911536 RepID=A0ABS7CSJ8_9BACT|nr:serine hydrolase domain-containing protein [Pontibacter aydingkolensis]MBW7466818.1 beta-lactamase family protein [Pontibacter aydingkolensis]